MLLDLRFPRAICRRFCIGERRRLGKRHVCVNVRQTDVFVFLVFFE